jgi:type I restriction enzyme S subunit
LIDSWPRLRLADVCARITVGHVGPMAHRYVSSGIPFLRSQNVQPFRLDLAGIKFIDEAFHAELRKSALSPGDVVVVRTGYPGTACVVPKSLPRANCADMVVITPSDSLHPYFLAALFNSTWGRGSVGGVLVGVAQQHFNIAAARAMEVPLPPFPEQYKIAGILSAYDDLIENSIRRIKLLEEIARAIYREWFVDFRFPGHKGIRMVESELGPIPEGWEVQPFSELAEYVNGFAFGPEHWGSVGRPIIKIKELKAGVTSETPRYAGTNIPPKFNISDGDLLFSWSADLGAYLWAGGEALLNQHLFNVVPVPALNRTYMFHALSEAMPGFRARSAGTTMRHIKRSALAEVRTVIPPDSLIEGFREVAEPLHSLSRVLARANPRLRLARELLLPKLVSGDIDVSALDIDASDQAA